MIGNADKGNNIQQSNQKLFEKMAKKLQKPPTICMAPHKRLKAQKNEGAESL